MKRVQTGAVLLLFCTLCHAQPHNRVTEALAEFHEASLFNTISDRVLSQGLGLVAHADEVSPSLVSDEQALNSFLQQQTLSRAGDIIKSSSRLLNDAFAYCAQVYTAPAVR